MAVSSPTSSQATFKDLDPPPQDKLVKEYLKLKEQLKQIRQRSHSKDTSR